TAGVTVTYDDGTQEWTFDFGPTVTQLFIDNGGITFYTVLKDCYGNEWGSMSPTTPANTFAYTFDNVAPTLGGVTPSEGDYCLYGENFTWTIQASDANLYSLELDHSMEGVLPEFTVYANAGDPYGSPQALADFTAAGVTVTFDDLTNEWIFDFGAAITQMFIDNGGITFFTVLEDCNG